MTNDELSELTKDELIELIEEKDQEIESLESDLEDAGTQITVHEESSVDLEALAEAAFKAGNPELWGGLSQIQAWLNHKIEARL